MSYNDDILYHLASNPDHVSFNGLQARLGRNITERDLGRVLPESVIKALQDKHPREPFLDSDVRALAEQPIKRSKKVNAHSSVFFWGTRGSGKTAVIGTLLACVPQDWVVREKPTANRRERALELNKFFQPGKVILPNSTNDPARAQYSRVYYKKHLREYAISLIEAPLPKDGEMDPELEYLLEQEGEQIHILCFDYTQDQETQSDEFWYLLDMLEKRFGNSIQNRTAGIYVLVTKTDAMHRVPREHRDDAAQTLITAGNRMLWSKIWNLCYNYGIRGTFPVSYSIGQVQLLQMADVDLTAARRLWKDILIPFSQPIPTVLESVLWTGNGWVTGLLFLLSLVGMGKQVVNVRQIAAPEEMLSVFNYEEFFRQTEGRDVSGKPYKTARNAYNSMVADLNRESHILTTDGKPLMAEEEVVGCRKPLANDMAKIAVEAAERNRKRDYWDYETIKDMRYMFKRLKDSGCLGVSNEGDVNEWYRTYSFYLDKICKLPKTPCFATLDGVKRHRTTAESYMREKPFSGSKYVRGELDNSVAKADEYYADYVYGMTEGFHSYYNLPKNTSSDIYGKYLTRKRELERLIEDFKNYLPETQRNSGYNAYKVIQAASSYVNTTNCRKPNTTSGSVSGNGYNFRLPKAGRR